MFAWFWGQAVPWRETTSDVLIAVADPGLDARAAALHVGARPPAASTATPCC